MSHCDDVDLVADKDNFLTLNSSNRYHRYDLSRLRAETMIRCADKPLPFDRSTSVKGKYDFVRNSCALISEETRVLQH